MPRIGRYPFFGKRFFRQIRKIIGSCHFEHFWRVVLCLASMHGRRSLRTIEKLTGRRRTRQSIAFFLSQAEWDAPELLRTHARAILERLGYRPGEKLFVVIDDTQKQKRAQVMQAVSKIFLHAQKVYADGHTILGCVLVYRGVVIPYAVKLWAAESACRESQKQKDAADRLAFHKLTTLAAEALGEVTLPAQGRAVALFDSYYLCPTVIDACKTAGFRYISVAKKNRNFSPDGRANDKRKLGQYGRNVLRRCGRTLVAAGKRHRTAERVGHLSRAGRVKLVFSQRPRDRAWVVLVTNETRWGMRAVLEQYFQRWPIEVLFKMSKQHLGLGDYQLLRYRGVVRYLHLVMIASLLLTHLALTGPGAQANRKTNTPLRLPSVPELQSLLRRKLWDDLVETLDANKKTRAAARELKKRILL